MATTKRKLNTLTIHEAAKLLEAGEISSAELTESVLAQIDESEEAIHAYITTTPEIARVQARGIDQRRAAGERLGPLAGIPVAVKDIICTKGVRTTAGSKMLSTFVPPYSATVVRKLEEAGAVLVGKANMDEFAMGSSTEFSAFGPTKNPLDQTRVPGGSSGGSAAAVASGEALFALGTDTGGSVRLPAHFCGLVGLKPTYGLVSRFGVIAFASSLDQVGPLTRDVTDCALVLSAISGHDPNDSTSIDQVVPDYFSTLQKAHQGATSSRPLNGLRVGVPDEYFVSGMQPEVESSVRESIRMLESLGASVDRTSLPHTRYALDAYYIIAPAEASANLARYDGVKYGLSLGQSGDIFHAFEETREEGFGPEVKRRIMLGTYTLSSGYYDAYYLRAQKVRTLIKRDFDEAFSRFDLLVTPTAPSVAFKLGERTDNPLEMYLTDVCTVTVNIAGIPGLVVPCGQSNGLPIGLQLLGPALGEETLLRVGYAFELARGKDATQGR